MSIVIEKGAVRDQLKNVEHAEAFSVINEVIDDRMHSKSNKVYLEFTEKAYAVGFENKASQEQIDNMSKFFTESKEQKKISNIACKGIGLKHFEYKFQGKWTHYSYHEDLGVVYSSESNTKCINDALHDPNISQTHFSTYLNRYTRTQGEEPVGWVKETDYYKIMRNHTGEYPFMANTLFLCRTYDNIVPFTDTEQDNKFETIIKRFKIKYYHEIAQGLELYIKFPGFSTFVKLENDICDVIGSLHQMHALSINIYICKNIHLGYYFDVNGEYYVCKKNGNGKLKEKYTPTDKTKTPDFVLTQYNISTMTPEERKRSTESNKEDNYAGIFIRIGNTFISDKYVKNDERHDRNEPGGKCYRAILDCNTEEAKHSLPFSGYKSCFNLNKIGELKSLLTELMKSYKKLRDTSKTTNQNDTITHPDKYILICSTATKSKNTKIVEGYTYVMKIGENLYKIGKSSKKTRIFDYATDAIIKKTREEFPDINIYENPVCIFMTTKPDSNYSSSECSMKELLVELNRDNHCTTYNNKIGSDIREYFYTENIHYVLHKINEMTP